MLSPVQIAEKYVSVGKSKAEMPVAKMFVLAIFAGIFIAIAGASATVASSMIENASLARLVNALVFPAGLAMVVLAGSELFTGNCLILIPVLKKEVKVFSYIRALAVVYIGNLIGSLAVAFLFVYSHTPDLYSGKLAESFVNTAVTKVSLSFSDAFLRAILCNILVCIAVWITIGASNTVDKIAGLYFPIMIFVLGGYEHCVANMFYIPVGILCASEYGIAADGLNWGTFVVNNLIPVTIGNVIGGTIVVALGYWFAYLKEDKKK